MRCKRDININYLTLIFLIILYFSLRFFLATANAQSSAGAEKPPAFMPIWKLMPPAEKRVFLAGYLKGWTDARDILKIVMNFVREQPAEAANSLAKVIAIYDFSFLKPEYLVERLDSFYLKSDNKERSLIEAITASR